MTTDLGLPPLEPPRPGSALAADVNLQAALADRLRRLDPALPERDRFGARDMWSILAVYPWQEYAYRYGAWEPMEADNWIYYVTLGAWQTYEWIRWDRSFQLLDPYSGQRISEFYTRPEGVLAMPHGRLLFAGNPQTAGVYWPIGRGIETISLARQFLSRNQEQFKAVEQLRRQDVEQLRRGAPQLPPTIMPVNYDVYDELRVWYTESAEKPTRRASNPAGLSSYRVEKAIRAERKRRAA